jgi:hypothetical protein
MLPVTVRSSLDNRNLICFNTRVPCGDPIRVIVGGDTRHCPNPSTSFLSCQLTCALTQWACATSAIKEVEEPTFCGRFLGSCGVNYHQAPPGPQFIAIERARAKWGSLRLACFDLSDGPGSTEHTAEAFAGSDIVGPPLKANENWDGRMVRCLFLSEVVALRRGYSVK